MSKAQWIQENLKTGELYAGIILGKNGEKDYHLVLLPDLPKRTFNWDGAFIWSTKVVGGDLPTRREQSLLYANLKETFEAVWYWSGEQDKAHSGYAWMQGFGNGAQNNYRKSFECRARAVRRIYIEEK
jgi:hypothetical protein